MNLHIIFAQRACRYEGEHAPEALAIADEYSNDENPAWIEGELAKAKANSEFIEAAIFTINIGAEGFKSINLRLNGRTVVGGTVIHE